VVVGGGDETIVLTGVRVVDNVDVELERVGREVGRRTRGTVSTKIVRLSSLRSGRISRLTPPLEAGVDVRLTVELEVETVALLGLVLTRLG